MSTTVRTRRRRWLVYGVVALVAFLYLRSCGDDEPSLFGSGPSGDFRNTFPRQTAPGSPTPSQTPDINAERTLEQAHAVMSAATSVDVTVDIVRTGVTAKADLVLNRQGDMQGEVSAISTGGTLLNVRRVGDRCWVNDPPQSEYQPTCQAQVDEELALDLRTFARFDLLLDAVSPAQLGSVETGEQTKIDRVEVVELKGAADTSLFVRLDGDPRPVRLTRGEFTYTFNSWDVPLAISPPTDVVE